MKKNSKKILITLTIITNVIYILWRIFYTVPKEEGKFALICAIILFCRDNGHDGNVCALLWYVKY